MSKPTDPNETTLSSPNSLDELNRVPVTILRILAMLGPAIRRCKNLLRIVMWNSGQPRESILLLFLWVVCCVCPWQVLTFGLPLLVVAKVGRDWLHVRTTLAKREALEKRRQKYREERSKRKKSVSSTNEEEKEDGDDICLRQQFPYQEKEEETTLLRKIQPDGHVSLDDTIQDLQELCGYLDCAQQRSNAILLHLDGSQAGTLTRTIRTLLYVCPLWALLTWSIDVGGTLALLGGLFLVSPSPWCKVLVMTIRQDKVLSYTAATLWAYGVTVISSWSLFQWWTPFITTNRCPSKWQRVRQWLSSMASRAKGEQAKAYDVIKKNHVVSQQAQETQNETSLQFEIYENQRWWLGMGWTKNMMPSERGPWTDKRLAPIPPKEDFPLPEPSQRTTERVMPDGKTRKYITTKTWSWTDADWWVDMTGELHGEVDHHGWEYGNNAWKQLTSTPAISTHYTRRRRWCRRARLVEHLQEDHEGLRKRGGHL